MKRSASSQAESREGTRYLSFHLATETYAFELSRVREVIDLVSSGFFSTEDPALFQPLRVALTGLPGGPDLFDAMAWLGAPATLRRIEVALERLA